MMAKRATTRSRPGKGAGTKNSKADYTPVTDHEIRVMFSFAHADRTYDGDWGWPRNHVEADCLLAFLCEISCLTWGEVDQQTYNDRGQKRTKLHHSQKFGDVCGAAQRRLAELHHDERFDEHEFFRFRLGSDRRVWGFRKDGVFYLLWWDPNHKVYPLD